MIDRISFPMRWSMIVLLLVLAGGSVGTCAGRTPRADPTEAMMSALPIAIIAMGERAERIYNYARTENWSAISGSHAALRSAVAGLPGTNPAEPARVTLDSAMTALGSAIRGQHRLTTMRAANDVTRIAANMAEPHGGKVPADVARLDFLAREIETRIIAGERESIRSTVAEMRETWTRLRPAVGALRGGRGLSGEFRVLLERLSSASTVDEYRGLLDDVFAKIDEIAVRFAEE